jgi:competence protein ComEA
MDSQPWLNPHRWRLVLLALPPALLLTALAAGLLFAPPTVGGASSSAGRGAPDGTGRPAAPALPPPATSGLLVEVSGAVARPGLYRMSKGERVSSAIAAAGGLSPSADPARLPNMAARLRDGQQVEVPALGAPSGSRSSRAALVDLNSATADELADVPGISPQLAAEAVRYRAQYGGFGSTQELVTVLGMSESDYQIARKHLHV